MRFGQDMPTTGVFADPRQSADLAVEAEQAGWEGFLSGISLSAAQNPTRPNPSPIRGAR